MSAPTIEPTVDRELILEAEIAKQARFGWRVLSRSSSQASLVKGKPVNHLLHLILSLLTVGLWVVVWVLVALFGGEKSKVVTIEANGHARYSR